MKSIFLCTIVGLMVFPCLAAESFTSTYTFDEKAGTLWDKEVVGKKDNLSVSWTQNLAGVQSGAPITEVTLTFTGNGIQNVNGAGDKDRAYEVMDCVTITCMGQTVGQLTGNTTTLQISPALLSDTMDFSADMEFQNDLRVTKKGKIKDKDKKDLLWLYGVTLNVVYGDPVPASQISTPPVSVPAPGALVLAGLGTLLVGILRRRKAI